MDSSPRPDSKKYVIRFAKQYDTIAAPTLMRRSFRYDTVSHLSPGW